MRKKTGEREIEREEQQRLGGPHGGDHRWRQGLSGRRAWRRRRRRREEKKKNNRRKEEKRKERGERVGGPRYVGRSLAGGPAGGGEVSKEA